MDKKVEKWDKKVDNFFDKIAKKIMDWLMIWYFNDISVNHPLIIKFVINQKKLV